MTKIRNFLRTIFFLIVLIPAAAVAAPTGTVGVVSSTTSTANTTSTVNTPSSSLNNLIGEASSTWEKARSLTQKVTTTAAMAKGIYDDGKGMVGEISKIIERGRTVVGNLNIYFQKLLVYWDQISNHNDKVRVGIIIGVAIIAILFLRRI